MILVIFGLAGLAVNKADKPDSAKETNGGGKYQQPEETIRDPTTWAPITIFTLALVVVGFGQAGLFFWQLGYLHSADETARRAADAATLAAKAAIEQGAIAQSALFASRRPHLIMQPIGDKVDYDITSLEDPQFHYWYVNYGNAPAVIIRSYNKIIVVERAFTKTDMEGFGAFHYYVVPPGQRTHATTVECTGSLTSVDKKRVRDGTRHLFAIGWVNYEGVLGAQHFSSFCWRYDRRDGQFHQWGVNQGYSRRT